MIEEARLGFERRARAADLALPYGGFAALAGDVGALQYLGVRRARDALSSRFSGSPSGKALFLFFLQPQFQPPARAASAAIFRPDRSRSSQFTHGLGS
jgi:hypothetical protein